MIHTCASRSIPVPGAHASQPCYVGAAARSTILSVPLAILLLQDPDQSPPPSKPSPDSSLSLSVQFPLGLSARMGPSGTAAHMGGAAATYTRMCVQRVPAPKAPAQTNPPDGEGADTGKMLQPRPGQTDGRQAWAPPCPWSQGGETPPHGHGGPCMRVQGSLSRLDSERKEKKENKES